MVATLESASIAEEQRLVFLLETGDVEVSSNHVELRVFEIDHIATRWKMSMPVTLRESSGRLVAEADQGTALDSGALYEALLIRREAGGTLGEVRIASDPDRLLFEIRSEGAQEADALALRRRHLELLRERERFFEQAFGDESAQNTYRAMILVAGLLVTTELRAPGLRVEPVDLPRGSEWDAHVLNGLLVGRGWGIAADPSGWAKASLRSSPMALITIDSVHASTAIEAHGAARKVGEAVLSVLALQRDAAGSIAACAVQNKDDFDDHGIAPGSSGYRGNLLGGFLSGEDPHGFAHEVRTVLADQRSALLLSLYAEAEGEPSLDSAYFRFWGLLELIAQHHIPSGEVVTDFDDRPFDVGPGGSAPTTSRARGKVYQLLKRIARASHMQASTSSLPDVPLWNATGSWVGRRNATAHYGGFRVGDAAQMRRGWYDDALASYRAAEAAGGQDRFHDPYFRWLCQWAKLAAVRELRGGGT